MGQRHTDGRFGNILLLAQVHIPDHDTDAWDPSCFLCKTSSSGEKAKKSIGVAQRAQPELWEAGWHLRRCPSPFWEPAGWAGQQARNHCWLLKIPDLYIRWTLPQPAGPRWPNKLRPHAPSQHPKSRALAVMPQAVAGSCWQTGAVWAATGCSAASLQPRAGSAAALLHVGVGGLCRAFRRDDYICKALGNALGWRALCKCKIMLFIEPGFIQNGIKLVFLKPLLSKTNWNLSPLL